MGRRWRKIHKTNLFTVTLQYSWQGVVGLVGVWHIILFVAVTIRDISVVARASCFFSSHSLFSFSALYTYSFIHLSIYLSVAITSFVVKFTHRCLQNAGSVYLSFKLLYTIVYLFSIFCIPKNILGHYRTCQRSRKSWGCYSSDAFVKCYHNIPRNVPYAVMTGSYKYKFTYQLGIYM